MHLDTPLIDKYILEHIDTETKFPDPDEPVRKNASNIFQTSLHDECNIQKS